MKKTIFGLVAAIAIIAGTASQARADDPPLTTDSPLVQCSSDVCAFDLVPPPDLGSTDGFFEGDQPPITPPAP